MRHHRASLGLHPLAPVHDDHAKHERQDLFWSRVRTTLREPFSEFWGTVIMISFGNGSIAQVLLSSGQTSGAPGGNGFGNYQSVNWGWGLGVMLGIYVAGDSGAYLNPAITFSNCLYRQLPWRRFPAYFIAQLLGSMVGSCIVYANYISAIDYYEGGHGIRTVPPAPKATAGIFATYPQPFVTKASQFFSEFIASAILMFVVFALKDRANMGMAKVRSVHVHVPTPVNAMDRAINGSHSCSCSSSSAWDHVLAGKPDMHSTLLATSDLASCRMLWGTDTRFGRRVDTISG
ncbi:hypothetical protein PMIN06_007317 [Paraphaeosphaeria minitans]